MFGSSVPNGILTSFSGTIIKDMGALPKFDVGSARLGASQAESAYSQASQPTTPLSSIVLVSISESSCCQRTLSDQHRAPS
jgi:hypothetical protein